MRLRCVLCHARGSKCRLCMIEDLERLAQVKKPRGLSVMTYADFRRTENSLAANHEGAEDREALEVPVCDACENDDPDFRCTDMTETDEGTVCNECLSEFERLRKNIEGIIRGEGWTSDEDLEDKVNDCLYEIDQLNQKVRGFCVGQDVRGLRYDGNTHGMRHRLRSYYDLVKEGTGNE